jgi:hypothetical protein
MPRIEVAGDICLRRPGPTQGCRADDDDDDELFGSSWPFVSTFSYCNWTASFYGLKCSPNCQIHKMNDVLFYL